MSKPAGLCIFCRGRGLSKEHLFSDWLRVLFPRHAGHTHTLGEAVRFDAQNNPTFATTQHQGHSGTKKFRIVCKRCNNEWLSGIDDAARIAVTPLIQGIAVTLKPEMQAQIAIWLAKIAMVGDSRRRKSSKIPQAQRDWLRERGFPPQGWEVWIAPYSGEELHELALFQFGGSLTLPGRPEGFMQFTVIGMGKLLALGTGTDIPNIRITFEPLDQMMTRVWPTGDAIRWPTEPAFSDAEGEMLVRVNHLMRAFLVDD